MSISSPIPKKTFWRIRKAIGWLGMGLPVVLVLFSLVPFFETGIKDSISSYYYSNLREIFTGTLCAVSLFLIRYEGTDNKNFWRNDKKLTNIAGIMALGVAFIPTNPGVCEEKIYTLLPSCIKYIGWVHYFFAASLFLILAIISINVFTIGQKRNENIPVYFLNENNIYRTCGWLIIVFIIMIPVFDLFNIFTSSTLLFEALALIAFGVSWLIKGRGLGYRGTIGKVLYREDNPT